MPPGQRREQLMGGEGRSRGKDFEQDLFGRPRIDDPVYRRKLSEARDKKTGYVPFEVAISLLVGIQPKARPFAFKLAHEVAKQLGNNQHFPDSKVRFYSAVDTPLDQFHGADALIELVQKDGELIRVRLGATTVNSNIKSERQSKEADVEIEEGWLDIENEDLLVREKIPELARQIIHQLEEKMATKEAA